MTLSAVIFWLSVQGEKIVWLIFLEQSKVKCIDKVPVNAFEKILHGGVWFAGIRSIVFLYIIVVSILTVQGPLLHSSASLPWLWPLKYIFIIYSILLQLMMIYWSTYLQLGHHLLFSFLIQIHHLLHQSFPPLHQMAQEMDQFYTAGNKL